MDETPDRSSMLAALRSLCSFGIVTLDPEGIITGWNRGASLLLGYEEAEVLGRSFTLMYLAADVEAGRPGHELRESEEVGLATDDNWLRRKDGTAIFASGMTEPLGDGALRGHVKVFRDQTDRRRMEDELRRRASELAESDRHKDRFLALLSHELRNPMAPIRHAVEVLQQQRAGDDTASRALEVIVRQTRQLGRLVEDLLDVTRIASGKLRLRRERIDLVELVRRAAEAAEPVFAERELAFEPTLPSAPIHVEGDPARLTQIVANLLSNAAKYTDAGRRVELAVERGAGGGARVRVRDEGVGIDPVLIGRIFEMFVQDDRHLERAQGGLGIGLSLAHRLALLHGGRLHARSAGPGHGAEFELELPVVAAPEPVAPPVTSEAATVAPGAIVVLVVDDNIDGADSLALLLRVLGHPVHVAYDGQAALDLAASVFPDLVLLDIGLPRMDGYEVARRLREMPSGQGCVIAAMTGFGAKADREHAFAAGCDHHLLKPVEPAAIEALLAEVGRRLAAPRRGAATAPVMPPA